MILTITEKEYRARKELNYSKVKEFNDDSRKFYRKYILGESIQDETDSQTSNAMRFGGLVDCILTAEQDFDYRYQITTAEKPSGQMLDFTEELYKQTLIYTDKDGVLTENMEFLYEIAYKKAGFKRDLLPTVLEKFVTKGLPYYTELRDKGHRTVITQQEYEKALSLIEKLRAHPYSAPLLNKVSDGRWEVINQLIMTGVVNGVEMKCMLDKVIIDKSKKIIYPYDLKTSDNAAMFAYNYLKRGYYLQLPTYTLILQENYPEYEVRPMSFLVVDNHMYFDPVLWVADEVNLKQGIEGFYDGNGKYYKGLYEILDDLKYAEEYNAWTTTRVIHQNKGRMELPVFHSGGVKELKQILSMED